MIVKTILKYAAIFVLTVILLLYPEKVAAGFSLVVSTLWDLAVNIGRSIHFPGKKEASASALMVLPGIIGKRNSLSSNILTKSEPNKENQS